MEILFSIKFMLNVNLKLSNLSTSAQYMRYICPQFQQSQFPWILMQFLFLKSTKLQPFVRISFRNMTVQHGLL